MLLPRTSQYALSAMLRLAALPAEAFFRVEDLVRDTDAPRHAVAKVLHALAKRGFLKSVRGAGGGYRLAEGAKQRRLIEIVEAIDGPWGRNQLVDRGLALPDEPCPLRELLAPLEGQLEDLLRTTTIEDLICLAASRAMKDGQAGPADRFSKG